MAAGLLKHADESVPKDVRRCGADIVEILRKTAGRDPVTGALVYTTGGGVDLTSVTAAGCRIETVRRWSDKVWEGRASLRAANRQSRAAACCAGGGSFIAVV
jgi:hypothetical protein